MTDIREQAARAAREWCEQRGWIDINPDDAFEAGALWGYETTKAGAARERITDAERAAIIAEARDPMGTCRGCGKPGRASTRTAGFCQTCIADARRNHL